MEPKQFAIVIGTSHYDDGGLARLKSPTRDAMNITRVLQDPTIGNYDVKMFVNASSYDIKKGIERFLIGLDSDDVLLFYFSGHGMRDDQGRFHFAAADTKINMLLSTAIPASFVNEALNQSRSRNQVLLLDSCFSGAFAKGMASSHGRVLITATDALQYAYEEEEGSEPATRPAAWEEGAKDSTLVTGVFTSAVIRGLETGYADLNLDGKISATELYNYVYEQLTLESDKQTPKIWMYNLAGDIVIAKNCRKP